MATLRKKDAVDLSEETEKKEKYPIPKGGLFALCWCPHYLFELVGWVGIAIVSNHFNYWLTVVVFTSSLSGRAKSTEDWYLEVFAGEPELDGNRRTALIPFLY